MSEGTLCDNAAHNIMTKPMSSHFQTAKKKIKDYQNKENARITKYIPSMAPDSDE